MPDNELHPAHKALLDRVDALSHSVATLAAHLEQRLSVQQFRSTEIQIPPNTRRSVTLPKGVGGVLLFAQNGGDLANIIATVVSVRYTFPANTTTVQFVPCPGVTAELELSNASSAAFPLTVQTLNLEYAMVFATALK